MIQCSIETRDLNHNSMWNCDPGHNVTWIFDPGSFHVQLWLNLELWHRVMIPRSILTRIKIPRWIVTPGHDSMLNSDPGSWFHVELWPEVKLWPGIGITIQCGILTQCHNLTWNFDPGSQFNIEFWPLYISSTCGIATQEVVKIQQRDQNSTA